MTIWVSVLVVFAVGRVSISELITQEEFNILNSLDRRLENVEEKIKSFSESHGQGSGSISPGSVYVRWGRNDCPKMSDLVYDGYMAGRRHHLNGGGANFLCLTKTPEYTALQSPNVVEGVFGVETDINGFDPKIDNMDASCAVCLTPNRTSLMIPGRKTCPSGWNIEYWGYLMSDLVRKGAQPTEYICTDNSPIGVPGGEADNNQSIIYLVGGMCGSLKCPPYINKKPLTCVVCSK